MMINTHDLGGSYLDADKLPALLILEEANIDVPYADSPDPATAKATIGIGVNLMVHDKAGNYPYLALVLESKGSPISRPASSE